MKTINCPFKVECKDSDKWAVGMFHCPYCSAMVLAGADPEVFCENDGRNPLDDLDLTDFITSDGC